MGEREKVMFDIHGISQSNDEYDPPNIEQILQQLECEIEKIKRKDAYNLAKVRTNEEKKTDECKKIKNIQKKCCIPVSPH